jgi:hypothetical protein
MDRWLMHQMEKYIKVCLKEISKMDKEKFMIL